MGVVFNGVTITAGTNKFYFNGTSVKSVYFNGVQVWQGLPTFSAGTSYQAVSVYARPTSRSVWITLQTNTFKGGDGSTCSVRAIAAAGTVFGSEYTNDVRGYGRVLRNGSQIAYETEVGSGPSDPDYSAFVTSSANYGDSFVFQCKCGETSGRGGGQIYTSTNSSGYW